MTIQECTRGIFKSWLDHNLIMVNLEPFKETFTKDGLEFLCKRPNHKPLEDPFITIYIPNSFIFIYQKV